MVSNGPDAAYTSTIKAGVERKILRRVLAFSIDASKADSCTSIVLTSGLFMTHVLARVARLAGENRYLHDHLH